MFIGTRYSGHVVDKHILENSLHDWTKIWLVPAYVAVGVLIYFLLFFREKRTATASLQQEEIRTM